MTSLMRSLTDEPDVNSLMDEPDVNSLMDEPDVNLLGKCIRELALS